MLGVRGHTSVLTKPGCPYCDKAKAFLRDADARYVEVAWSDLSAEEQTEIRTRVAGGPEAKFTFPRVFIGETMVGGFSDLEKLGLETVRDMTRLEVARGLVLENKDMDF